MKTSLNYTSGMQIVNNVAELKGVNQVYGGATFQDGDIVEIPENPQMQKFVRPNGKTRIEIGVLINGAAKWVNLAAFTKLPVEGEGEGFKAAFQKAHPVNDQIAQGDACSQILVLCELKKLKVHKEKNWDVILVQNENGKWGRKKRMRRENTSSVNPISQSLRLSRNRSNPNKLGGRVISPAQLIFLFFQLSHFSLQLSHFPLPTKTKTNM